jgi:hypothetical protein
MKSKYGIIFGAIVVLVLIALAYLLCRIVCVRGSGAEGYWATPSGDLFHIYDPPPQNGGYIASTASGFMGATQNGKYPVGFSGFRKITIAFPQGILQGRIGLDRRSIIWDNQQAWVRQGL